MGKSTQFLIDSKSLSEAVKEQKWQQNRPNITGGWISQKWEMRFGAQRKKNIAGRLRIFNEDQDLEFIALRMVARWVAKETMHQGIAERDNPSGGTTVRDQAKGNCTSLKGIERK